MRIKYFTHVLKSLPLLPIIYFQGKKIKKEIPLLPEALEPKGTVDLGFKKNLNVLFIGESSFAGVGSDLHKNSFAGHFSIDLAQQFHRNVIWKVYAKTGYNLERIHQNLLPKITEIKCDLLVIGIGGNDTFEMKSPGNWNKNLNILIKKLQHRFPVTPILFAQLPTIEAFPAFTKEMRIVLGRHKHILAETLYNNVLESKNIFYPPDKINIPEWMAQLEDDQTVLEFFSDGIHPSELCYKLWAHDCVNYLRSTTISFD